MTKTLHRQQFPSDADLKTTLEQHKPGVQGCLLKCIEEHPAVCGLVILPMEADIGFSHSSDLSREFVAFPGSTFLRKVTFCCCKYEESITSQTMNGQRHAENKVCLTSPSSLPTPVPHSRPSVCRLRWTCVDPVKQGPPISNLLPGNGATILS